MSEYRLIALRGKRGAGLSAKVSPEDFEFLNQFKWALASRYVAASIKDDAGKFRFTLMHRVVLERKLGRLPKGVLADHINGDSLDNTRENLRATTFKGNNQNRISRPGSSSKYKGVIYRGRGHCTWQAVIVVDRKYTHLGYFSTEEAAAKAYDAAAKYHFGEFAHTNFRDEVSPFL